MARPMTEKETELFKEFVKSLAPAFVNMSTARSVGLDGGPKIQVQIPVVADLTLQTAGFLVGEFMKRVNGENPTQGINGESLTE